MNCMDIMDLRWVFRHLSTSLKSNIEIILSFLFFKWKCRTVHSVPQDLQCDFVYKTHDCDVESFIEYISFIYCTFDPNDQWIAILISIIWTLVLFIALGVAATDFLCPALFMISKSLNMSQSVAGVTLIAFGNGSPDVFAAIAGMMQGRPGLVIGGLFGGGCFVVMMVLGTIFSVKSFTLMPQPFLRDITFYIIAVSWAFYLFVGPRIITLYDAVGEFSEWSLDKIISCFHFMTKFPFEWCLLKALIMMEIAFIHSFILSSFSVWYPCLILWLHFSWYMFQDKN